MDVDGSGPGRRDQGPGGQGYAPAGRGDGQHPGLRNPKAPKMAAERGLHPLRATWRSQVWGCVHQDRRAARGPGGRDATEAEPAQDLPEEAQRCFQVRRLD